MRKLAFLLILALMVAVVPAAAQDDEEMALPDFISHTECEVDLSGEEVTIFHLGDISSPGYSPITLPLLAGIEDAINYYNARGGVCGATFDQQNFDTGGDPNRTSEGYGQLAADDPDLLVLYSSADSELLRPTVIEDELPVIISAGSIPGLYGENADDPGWIYATNPLYADQFAMFCDYVAANPDTFPEPVIGYMGWGGPVAAFGLAAFTDSAVEYCESAGVEVIDEAQTFLPTADATSVAPLVENHINAGATIIYVNALASGPVRVAEAIELIGFSEELELASVNWGMDTSAALLSAGSLRASDGLPVIDGMYGSLPFYWYSDTDQPGIQLLLEQAAANERGIQTINISYILGWSLVDTYVEMYTLAANGVAAEEGLESGAEILEAIDGPVMREVIETMVYSPLGLYEQNFFDGATRSVTENRIVRFTFESAELTGPPAVEQLFPEEGFAAVPDTVGILTEAMGDMDMEEDMEEESEDEG
jgi:ABC-type branched-subunit amino acid transport system substrate-binding protein